MTDQNQQQIDQTALNLSRSIRKAEGGDYENTSGDAGTSAGAYQFNNGKIPLKKGEVPANFKSWASEEGLDPNDFSQANQDHVAYSRIKRKLDSGQAPSSVAAEWNSGLSKGWENHKGTVIINGKKIIYDTPGYVNKVKAEYERLSNGGGDSSPAEDTTDNTSSNKLTFDDIPNIDQTQESNKTGVLGTNPNDSTYGKVIDNSLTRGLINVVPGAKDLGEGIGSSLAYFGEKAKGLMGGQDNSEYIPKADIGKTLGGAAKTMTTAGLAGLASLAGGASALTAPEVGYNIPMTMEKFATLSNAEKLNTLGDALKTAGIGDSDKIMQAIKYLKPSPSWISKLIKGGISEATKYALISTLGNKIGGLIHNSIDK